MTRSINALWLVMIACSGTGTRGTSSSGAMADPVDRRGEQLPPGHRLYLQGEPHRGGDLDYTCSAPESAELACRAIHPQSPCHLVPPVGYWESSRCSGARMTKQDMDAEAARAAALAIPACQCDCSNDYQAARATYERARERCDTVP